MKRLKQLYLDMHIQTKFGLILLLVTLLPATIVIFFFCSRLYDMAVSYTIQQEQDASATTAPLIEELVQTVVDVSEGLEEYAFYEMLFHQPVNEPTSSLSQSDEADEFRNKIEQLTQGTPVTAIRFYLDLPDNESALFTDTNTKDIFAPMSEAKGTYWYGILQGNHASELYCPSFYLGVQEKAAYGDLSYVRVTTIYYEGNAYTAYIVVYYSSGQILEILSDNLTLDGSVSYIVNERNSTVATTDSALSGTYWVSYETIREFLLSSNNFIEHTLVDETAYVAFYSISGPGWFMVTVLPSDPLIALSNQMMASFVLTYIAALFAALLLANWLSRSITKRLASVGNQMSAVQEAPPRPMENPPAHDEIGELIDSYNYMARQINDLLEEREKSAEDLRISEFNSLQAQINPHFLYNTMDMINWLAQQGRTSEVSRAVQDLSRFYKLTLSRKQSIATVASEIEHITIYVRLQNMRYHDSISLITDIPEDLLEYHIPKLTLQPVIENAIQHGILEKVSKTGTIVVTGWMEGNDIVLLISDDGVGMTQEKLKHILQGTGQSTSGGTNIAIYNTHRRLQILYGESYGLSYTSQSGAGTEVQIRIPASRE